MSLEYIDYFRRFSGKFLEGRTAVVNGAGDPVGQAIARGLLAAGAVVVSACRSEAEAAALPSLPGEYEAISADPSDADQMDKLFSAASEKHGGVDIVVNNPPLGDAAALDRVSDAQVVDMFRESVLSALRLCRLAAPHMRRQKWGRIVNMGHFLAKSGSARRGPHFAAARSAMLGITKELTSELFADGVTVNAVAPGSIQGCAAEGGDVNPLHVPLGREGRPEEAAAPVLFLCSDHANFITGVCIDVNGGSYMD